MTRLSKKDAERKARLLARQMAMTFRQAAEALIAFQAGRVVAALDG